MSANDYPTPPELKLPRLYHCRHSSDGGITYFGQKFAPLSFISRFCHELCRGLPIFSQPQTRTRAAHQLHAASISARRRNACHHCHSSRALRVVKSHRYLSALLTPVAVSSIPAGSVAPAGNACHDLRQLPTYLTRRLLRSWVHKIRTPRSLLGL